MAEVEYRNQIVACAHAARLDGMIILSGFRHGDLWRCGRWTQNTPHFEGKGSIADFLQLLLDERAVVEPRLGRGALRQASISSCVAWMNSRTRSRTAASIRSNRELKRQTAISASNCGNSVSNRSNEDFVENPAGVGHLAGLRTYHLV